MKVSVQNNILSWGIDKNTPLVIGISGGPDSLALLHYLFIDGFNVVAMHVDHKLRNESSEDANFVKKAPSSTAASPPPTTAIICSLKKAPSHIAQ